MATYRMDMAYDGTRYSGWQKLGGSEETLQGKLEATLTRLLEEPVEVVGSGRTDAGVHARQQVVSFHTSKAVAPERLQAQLNHYLPSDMTVLRLAEAEPRFHARYHAQWKCYRYQLWNAALTNPLERRCRHHVPAQLDLTAMRQAADQLLGTHDFASFCQGKPKKSTVRTLAAIEFRVEGPKVDISLTGNGFLHNMVRIIVGTLLEIGQGRLPKDCMPEILAAKTRSKAGPMVPANGLILWSVTYEGETDAGKDPWEGLSV